MKITDHFADKLSSSGVVVSIKDLLLQELDEEIKKTRATLERVPASKKEFAPHSKSTPLGRLAPHVAQLAEFGSTVLTKPGLDFGAGSFVPVQFESGSQLAQVFDEGARKLRDTLQTVPDQAWTESWQLSFQGKTIFQGSRFLAYRAMFLNHLIHHRAQLGVYLRLTGNQVPATYGPSADEVV
ncbi:MAG TPA: DinB family protein [Terriglobales bacterium]|nr:DinB family protein [Terriglobales bacterium]